MQKHLGKLRMIEGDSVSAHLHSFESLIQKLKSSGAKLEEADVFLKLPKKFDPLVTAFQNLDKDNANAKEAIT